MDTAVLLWTSITTKRAYVVKQKEYAWHKFNFYPMENIQSI